MSRRSLFAAWLNAMDLEAWIHEPLATFDFWAGLVLARSPWLNAMDLEAWIHEPLATFDFWVGLDGNEPQESQEVRSVPVPPMPPTRTPRPKCWMVQYPNNLDARVNMRAELARLRADQAVFSVTQTLKTNSKNHWQVTFRDGYSKPVTSDLLGLKWERRLYV